MSTTSPRPRNRSTPPGVLAGAGAAAVLVTGATAIVAALASGHRAALGSLVGGGLVVAVFLFGALVVGAAAQVLPSAALLVALLTYTLQLLLLLVVFLAFRDSAQAQERMSGDWLGGGMVAATLAWITGQLVVTVRTPVEAWRPSGEGPEQGPKAGAR